MLLNKKDIKRDTRIDFLRFIGISLIILAHVLPPNIIFQLRSFDVPLMIFVSGLAYSNKIIVDYKNFIFQRIKRLLIPVYIFLTVYFIITAFLKMFHIDFGITIKHIIGSYLLMKGIGYVWIIRIFLIIAILTPVLLYISSKIKSLIVFIFICLLGIVAQGLMINYQIGMNSIFVRGVIYYAIGYSFIFMVGLKIKNLSVPEQIKITLVWAAVFLLSLLLFYYQADFTNEIIPFNNYKYPPRLYFIMYGIFASCMLFIVSRMIRGNRLINFIGSNTIWIYLYHIPLIQITSTVFIIKMWYIQYLIVYVLAVLICYTQISIVNQLKKRYIKLSGLLNYFKG